MLSVKLYQTELFKFKNFICFGFMNNYFSPDLLSVKSLVKCWTDSSKIFYKHFSLVWFDIPLGLYTWDSKSDINL